MNDTHDKRSGAPADARDGTAAGDLESPSAPEPRAPSPGDGAAGSDGMVGMDGAAADAEEARLVPQGNPLRWRGAAVSAAGALLTFVVMALAPQLRWGVPIGALGVAIAAIGLLDLLGTFDDPPSASPRASGSAISSARSRCSGAGSSRSSP